MRHTNRQTIRRTLTDLYRAIDRRHAVTITYRDRHGETTVRTIEIAELRTTSEGHIHVIAMCRMDKAERRFAVSGILAYTVHRSGYVLTRPEPTIYERPEPAPANDAEALISHELARDPDDADYRPRRKLAQTDTRLAA